MACTIGLPQCTFPENFKALAITVLKLWSLQAAYRPTLPLGGILPQISPSLGGYLEPNLIRHSLDPPDSTTHSAPASDQPSLYTPRTLFFPYTLQWGFLPLNFPLPLGGPGPRPNTLLLWPTPVHTPNGVSIGSAVLKLWYFQSAYTLQWGGIW